MIIDTSSFCGSGLPSVSMIHTEIFEKDVYRIAYLKERGFQPKVIWDIGGNIGLFSRAANILWPDCMVHAWEPHPELRGYFEANAPKAILHDKIAWSCVDSMELVCSLHKNTGGSYLKQLANNLGYTDSEATRSYLCQTEIPWDNAPEPDLVKFDCEGSEYALLQNMPNRPKYVSVEFHHGKVFFGIEDAKRLRPEYDWTYTERKVKTRSTLFGERKE